MGGALARSLLDSILSFAGDFSSIPPAIVAVRFSVVAWEGKLTMSTAESIRDRGLESIDPTLTDLPWLARRGWLLRIHP